MSDEQNSFQDRIARIKAQEQAKGAPREPVMPDEAMADLKSLRRNTSGISFGDMTNSLFDIPGVRYGLPILIAVFGFGMLSQFIPTGMGKMIAVDMEAVEGEQKLRPNPFNSAAIARQNMPNFGDFSGQSADGSVSRAVPVRP